MVLFRAVTVTISFGCVRLRLLLKFRFGYGSVTVFYCCWLPTGTQAGLNFFRETAVGPQTAFNLCLGRVQKFNTISKAKCIGVHGP
jgi:hypothetical protein